MKNYIIASVLIVVLANTFLIGSSIINDTEDQRRFVLSERELHVDNGLGALSDDSLPQLKFNWRVKSNDRNVNNRYQPKEVEITHSKLVSLGFKAVNKRATHNNRQRQLYWAMEFDGKAYSSELDKANRALQLSKERYAKAPTEINKINVKRNNDWVEKEVSLNSRLFYLESSSDFSTFSNKFSNNENVVIVSGLSSYYYDVSKELYFLSLDKMLVEKVTMPLGYRGYLDQAIGKPTKYKVRIKWGSLLYPVILNVESVR
jgi:hypothetical protein